MTASTTVGQADEPFPDPNHAAGAVAVWFTPACTGVTLVVCEVPGRLWGRAGRIRYGDLCVEELSFHEHRGVADQGHASLRFRTGGSYSLSGRATMAGVAVRKHAIRTGTGECL